MFEDPPPHPSSISTAPLTPTNKFTTMLCGRLFINTWPCLSTKELSINTGVTSVEYGAYMRMPVFPCKHKCCCYIAQRSNLRRLYNLIGPEGCEGIDCISNQRNF